MASGTAIMPASANFTVGKVIRPDVRLDVGSLALVDLTHSQTMISALDQAAGAFTFTAQPAAGATITLGTTVWTFVASGATGNQVNIGASLAATLTALAAALNASADAQTALCTYNVGAVVASSLGVKYKTAGVLGNAFAIAASGTSNAVVSASKLTGGDCPGNGSTVTNLALSTALPLIPTLTEAQSRLTWVRDASPTSTLIERTARGALHGVVSKVNQGSLSYYHLNGNPISEYIRNNPTRTYGWCYSGIVTRVATAGQAMMGGIYNSTGAASAYLYNQSEFGIAVGAYVAGGTAAGFTGAVPTSGQIGTPLLAFGSTVGFFGLSRYGIASRIAYSAHFADVTAWLAANPGKVASDWYAAQVGLHNVLIAAGGRYGGDTYAINPANFA